MVAIVLCLVVAPTQPALAHRLQVFAAAEGRTIAGDAYFAGGAPAAGIRVLIEDATGKRLAELTSGPDGAFRYRAEAPIDHIVVAQSGDGHRAQWRVAADELTLGFGAAAPDSVAAASDSVAAATVDYVADIADADAAAIVDADAAPAAPEASGQPKALGAAAEHGSPRAEQPVPSAGTISGQRAPVPTAPDAALVAAVEAAVARQIRPLREELAEARGQAAFRDVLGGIGYIVGLAGLLLWWRGRGRGTR
jgi:nickel transport protein